MDPWFGKGFEYGKIQGRLERDLELREAIETLKEFVGVEGFSFRNDIDRMIKNLKPLNPE